jgi:hypothetical protein
MAGYDIQTHLQGHKGVVLTLIDTLRTIISRFIVEGVKQSTLDILGGYIDFLICHVSKTTFETVSECYLDGSQQVKV